MLKKPEQSIDREGQPLDGGQPVQLRLDPAIASSNWVLLRGRVELPRVKARLGWLFGRRKIPPDNALLGVTLEVQLPDSDSAHSIAIGPDGAFDVHLPRLRGAPRRVCLTLSHHGQKISQLAPLFTPRPGASRGVIVLSHGETVPVINRSSPEGGRSGTEPLSEISRELAGLVSSHAHAGGPNPVFYLAPPDHGGATADKHRHAAWPEGLTIPIQMQGSTAAPASEQAGWICRLIELFGNEMDFVVIADTNRQSVAALRAISRMEVPSQRLQAVFLSDTRPVARGIRLQSETPAGITGLTLPIVVCRTLEEARRAVSTCGLTNPLPESTQPVVQPVRRSSAAHARVTRYPLVFCHGMLGYSVLKLRRVDLANYFNGLRELLSERVFRVLMPELGRTHSIEQRAEQLRQTIGRWTSEPVNIIGHSMGGLDARFLISKLDMADRVASLTTIATPHHGSSFADWFIDGFDAKLPFLRSLEQFGIEVEGFRDVTRAACRAFNRNIPDSPKVRYYSYSAFQVARRIPPVLRRSHSMIARLEGANDGLVAETSARWGEHVATLRADHLSLVGEYGPEYFDHLTFFQRIAEDLVRHGF
jgi:triacylglycerol lipase